MSRQDRIPILKLGLSATFVLDDYTNLDLDLYPISRVIMLALNVYSSKLSALRPLIHRRYIRFDADQSLDIYYSSIVKTVQRIYTQTYPNKE